MILKNKYIENNTKFNSEICIIGSGMSSQILASTFKTKDIIIVESGKIEFDSKIQELNSFNQIGLKFRENHQNRIRQLGGSANLWANQLMTLDADEVSDRNWVINNFSWPISFSELNNYYERVINLIYENNLEKNYIKNSKFEEYFLNDDVFEFKNHYWPQKVESFNKNSKFTNKLLKSENVRFIENFTCTNLQVNNDTSNIEYIDIEAENKSCKVFSKIFILACGALENARIILNNAEKNKIFHNNNTGRYYMDHPRQTLGILNLKENVKINSLYGIKKINKSFRRSLQLSSNVKKENRLLNSYCFLEPKFSQDELNLFNEVVDDIKKIFNFSRFPKINLNKLNINKLFQFYYFILPSQASNSIINNLIYNYLNLINPNLIFEDLSIQYQSEQSPNFESKIYLSKDFDVYKQKKLIIDWRLDKLDQKTTDFFLSSFKNKFLSSTYFSFKENKNKEISDASHHSGTTRISNNRDDGVIDLNNKFHNIDNLYISGSSTFRISGSSNPGLTNMAMSLRLGDHINNL